MTQSAQLDSWDLSSVQEFVPTIERRFDGVRQRTITTAGAHDAVVTAFPFDLKSMFTELDDKEAVMETATWILRSNPTWQRQRGKRHKYPRGAWLCKKDGRWRVRAGPGLRGGADEDFLPFQVVLDVVRFDLDNAYMQCGQHVMKQRFGVPMGSYLSAVLAITTVSVCEHRFIQRLDPTVAARVAGVRYADDGVMLVATPVTTVPRAPTGTTAAEIFHMFHKGCYPPPLDLELELHQGLFDLLESSLFTDGFTIRARHRSKLWSTWTPEHGARYRTWTGRGSWTGARRGTLIGALLRADAATSHGGGHFLSRTAAILRMAVEAGLFGGYSDRAVRGAFLHLSAARGGVWHWLVWWCNRHRTIIDALSYYLSFISDTLSAWCLAPPSRPLFA